MRIGNRLAAKTPALSSTQPAFGGFWQKGSVKSLTQALKAQGIAEPRVSEMMILDGRGPYLVVQFNSAQERAAILKVLKAQANFQPRLGGNDAPFMEEGYRFKGVDVGLFDTPKSEEWLANKRKN